ncbi:MAG: Cys-tRNA(Pro) deacylase, partial [Clostridia bacterium]|nr:Cys-tRNA(Pro) deacylase [Clostridia bacterium]
MTKTNAMRLLETAGIPFEVGEYEVDEEDLSGVHAAKIMGLDPDKMFKTLVCRDDRGGYEVFVIPVAYELNLKKCAAAAHVKRVEMIHVKEL